MRNGETKEHDHSWQARLHQAHGHTLDSNDSRPNIEAMIDIARGLVESDADLGSAYAIFAGALELDPTRIEVHVDLAALDYRAGAFDRVQARIGQLADAYVERTLVSDARAVLSAAEGWEEEFESSWALQLGEDDASEVPACNGAVPPPATGDDGRLPPQRRAEILSRYSIQTLRARARVRRDPSVTSVPAETSLATSLRRLSNSK